MLHVLMLQKQQQQHRASESMCVCRMLRLSTVSSLDRYHLYMSSLRQILKNQTTIERNQDRLLAIEKNQHTIIANQQRIEAGIKEAIKNQVSRSSGGDESSDEVITR